MSTIRCDIVSAEAQIYSGEATLVVATGEVGAGAVLHAGHAGAQAGAPLSTHPDVDLVSFTGGLATGKTIAQAAAGTVKKVALELGGKNPNVIFPDAHYEAALDNALNAGFLDSGLVCSAGTRLIVQDTIRDRFVDELVRRAARIRLGRPFADGTETGQDAGVWGGMSEEERRALRRRKNRGRRRAAAI